MVGWKIERRYSAHPTVLGNGNISSQYHLKNADAKMITDALQMNEFIGAKITILGSIEASGRSPAALISSLTGSGTADIKMQSFQALTRIHYPIFSLLLTKKVLKYWQKICYPPFLKQSTKARLAFPKFPCPS